LADALTGDMKDLLATTLLLSGAHDDMTNRLFAPRAVARAFDADGNPAVGTTPKPPGELVSLAGQRSRA
jgi:hypothetical protein